MFKRSGMDYKMLEYPKVKFTFGIVMVGNDVREELPYHVLKNDRQILRIM